MSDELIKMETGEEVNFWLHSGRMLSQREVLLRSGFPEGGEIIELLENLAAGFILRKLVSQA